MAYRVPVLESFNWQLPVLDILDTPPASPVKGDRYIVKATATGGWVGKENKIAFCSDDIGTWRFDTPVEGWFTVNTATKEIIHFTGGSWSLVEASQILVDNSKFSVQIPSTSNMTLQELLEWLDKNVGGPGPMGTPSDGSFTDGLLDWTTTTKVVDALDDTNEILSELAPAQANTLNGTTLVNNRTLYSGKLSGGLDSATWYQDGKVAGSSVTNVVNQTSMTLTTPSTSDTYGKADEGKLEAYYDTTKVATLDIAANFNEAERASSQTIANWDAQGTGDPTSNGVTNFSTSNGSLQVTSVAKYNNFKKWQKGNAQLNVTTMASGFHQFQMVHVVPAGSRSTTITKVFYDNDAAALSFSSSPTLTEKSLTSSRYVSGVRYYSSNDVLTLSFAASNLFGNIYDATRVAAYTFLGSTVNLNPTGTPNKGDSFDKTGSNAIDISIAAANTYNINATATVNLYHPFKSGANATSPNANILINTYATNRSSNTTDYFTDENFRLPLAFNTDSIPANDAAISGQWVSGNQLGSTDALVYNSKLQYGNIDLSGTLPSGNPNYSSKSGNQQYMRAFYIGGSKSSMTLTLPGLSSSVVGSLGTNNVNIEVKLPTQTGWLDAGKAYNGPDYHAADGDGCQTSFSGTTLNVTFGTKTSTNSGGYVFVRITFRNATSSLSANLVAA